MYCTCIFPNTVASIYCFVEPNFALFSIDDNFPLSSISSFSVAIDSMKQFLKASGSDQMLEKLEMNSVWPLMEKDDTCPHAMLHFARCACTTFSDCLGCAVLFMHVQVVSCKCSLQCL